MTKPLVTPPSVRMILTREAAKLLGCSMRQVRALAATGRIKCWELGPKSYGYDLEEIRRYKAERDAGRKAGTFHGPAPKGFSGYLTPSKRQQK